MTVPLHQQLAETLLQQIHDGTIAVGDRLPTEEQLCATHGLARGTVRRALGRLDQLGMISRRPRAGTVVVARQPLSTYQPVAQTVSDIATLAAETRLVRPQTHEVRLDAAGAHRVGARRGSAWFVVEGLRARRGSTEPPMCWSEHYLRADLPRDLLLRHQFDEAEVAGTKIEQVISAALIDQDKAASLGVPADSAALIVTRRHRDARGRLASVGIHTHPADRYAITMIVN